MTYAAATARREMLQTIAEAIADLARALAALTAAYELLDEHAADVMEDRLFGPAQLAYGRAKRTYAAFGQRHGLPPRAFPAAPAPGAALRAPELLQAAADAFGAADGTLADLQDSLKPVEVGDAELRGGLAEVRTIIGNLPARSRELQSRLGR